MNIFTVKIFIIAILIVIMNNKMLIISLYIYIDKYNNIVFNHSSYHNIK